MDGSHGGKSMSYEEAEEVVDNICPCHDPGCPDSDPIRQGMLSEAIAVLHADWFYVDAQIEAHLEAQAFGDYDERLEP